MENQPNEIILQELLLLPYKDILRMCSTNKHLKNICNKNEDYIYKELLRRDFNAKNTTNKSLYIGKNKKKNFKIKEFKRLLREYVNSHRISSNIDPELTESINGLYYDDGFNYKIELNEILTDDEKEELILEIEDIFQGWPLIINL